MNTKTAGLQNAAMAVVGGGTMGVGIAYVYAAAGWATFVAEPDDARAQAMSDTLSQTAQAGVRRSKLSDDEARALLGRIRRVSAIAELPQGLDLVVESVPEPTTT